METTLSSQGYRECSQPRLCLWNKVREREDNIKIKIVVSQRSNPPALWPSSGTSDLAPL
jgi:hypothetical protein